MVWNKREQIIYFHWVICFEFLVELSSFKTPNRHGYSVQFAPFAYNCLAVASSQYYGSVGGGTVFILQVTDDGSLIQSHAIEWSDGLFDVVS